MNNSQKAKMFFLLGNLTSCFSAYAASRATPPPPPEPPPYYYDANSSNFFIYSDYLLWFPFVDNGLQWIEIPPSDIPQVPVLKYKWGSGFRAEVGYRGSQGTPTNYVHPWQVLASYLTFEAKAPTITGSSTPPALFNYFSNSTFNYNRLDLAAAWPFWPSTNTIFRILLGASGVQVKDKIQISSNALNLIPPDIESDNWDFRWKYFAGGLLTGIDASLPLGYGIGIYANLTSIFFSGNMRQKANFTHAQGSSELEFSNSFKLTVPKTFLDLKAGLDFKHGIQKKSFVYLFVGYESTWMFNIDPVRRQLELSSENIFTNTPTTMGVQGITVRFGFEF